jgi:hypothetical protein
MTRWFAALLFALIVPMAYADAKDDAIRSAAEDCVTTGGALALGLSEANPLGPVAACGLKPLLLEAVQDQREPERTHSMRAIHAVWGAASVNNVMAMIGAGTAAPVFGAFVAVGLWAAGEEEREFARLCAIHEQMAGRRLRCIYTKAPA